MTVINNHFERAISLLAGQFRGKPSEDGYSNLQKLIKAFAESYQEADDANQQLLSERSLETAFGVQLDGLGEILGLPREDGESDDDYRERLIFQSFINNASGTPEDVMRVLKFLTNATQVGYNELDFGAYQMWTNGTEFPDPPEQLVTAIQNVSPAAIQYVPITATYGSELPFQFSNDPDFQLLVVAPDPDNINDLRNVEVDTAELLEVNSGLLFQPSDAGGFSEALGTYPNYTLDETGAGELAEVIMFNGSQAPPY